MSNLTIEQVWQQWNEANPDNASKISADVKKRIEDANNIMRKIREEGYDEHIGLIEEAVEYFLLDVLQDEDFERLKRTMKIK